MPTTWKERHIEVDGVRTRYIEAGEGQTVILIHGALQFACGELN